jgi:hypothetical protein
MNIWLNDNELSALDGLPPLHFKLYLAALKRHMDSKSGLIGLKRGISWQSILECVFIEPRSGVDIVSPSKGQVRRAVATLETVGLITKIEAGKKLVFKCELATLDRSVQKQAGRPTAYQADTPEHKIIPINSEAYSEENPQADIPKNTQADTPLIGLDIKKKDIPKGISKKESRRQLPADFQVTPQHMHLAHKNGWPNPHEEFEAFKDYHGSRGSVMLDWDKAFHTWLRNAKRFNARDNRGVNNHATYRQPSAAVTNAATFWDWAAEQAALTAESAILEEAENVYPIFQ